MLCVWEYYIYMDTLTVEELQFIVETNANANATAEDREKARLLYETKKLPDDVVEPFFEIAGEEDDDYYK